MRIDTAKLQITGMTMLASGSAMMNYVNNEVAWRIGSWFLVLGPLLAILGCLTGSKNEKKGH